MRVCVNGEDRELPTGSTVADLVDLLGVHPRRVAIERNRRVVRRARYAETPLSDGDSLEVVTLVGGG